MHFSHSVHLCVDPRPTSWEMSAGELAGDNKHFTTVEADSVCVIALVNFTAYVIAADDSLCYSENSVILVTAICAHNSTIQICHSLISSSYVWGVLYNACTSL